MIHAEFYNIVIKSQQKSKKEKLMLVKSTKFSKILNQCFQNV
jgi:hypothetical protein